MAASATDYRNDRTPAGGRGRHGAFARLAVLISLVALGAAPAPTAEELAARRAKIDAMDPATRQELLRRYERFSQLSAEEQQRLRDLQAEISADPNSERLHRILERYHEWLKTITPSQRAELAELPYDKRVERIERIQRHQKIGQRLESLAPQDTPAIMRWIYDLAKKYGDDVVADMDERDRDRFARLDRSAQQRWLVFRIFGGRRGSQRQSRVTPDDIERLAVRLSDGARAELAADGSPEAQRRLVGAWVYGTLYRSGSWRGDRRVNPLIGEELLEFLQDEVPPAERERLLKKPREEMLRELRKMYFERGHREDGLPPIGPQFDRRRRSGRSKGPRPDKADDGPQDGTPAPGEPEPRDKT